MKKSLLLLIPSLFLVASCNNAKDDGNQEEEQEQERLPSPCENDDCVDDNFDALCDVCGWPVEVRNATSCGGEPAAPFFLNKGDSKVVRAKLSPSPTYSTQKTFTWNNKNSSIVRVDVNPEKSSEVTLTGLNPGTATIIATNDFNPSLTRTFTVTVVDFDQDNMYMWQYNKTDVEQFGTSHGKEGTTQGTATLNGLQWDYERSSAISIGTSSGGGALQFGRSKEPETTVKLINHNHRKVKNIVVETSSAKGLANIEMKVGDTQVYSGKTPVFDKSTGIVSTTDLDNLEGDISIEFSTPGFDPQQAELDPYYKAPGAVYIKSIWITYAPESFEIKNTYSYDLAAKYADAEDEHFSNLPSGGKDVVISDENIEISFSNVRPEDEKIGKYAKTNGDIFIKLKNTDEVIKRVEFEYAHGSSANPYDLTASILGGEPYTKFIGNGNSDKVALTLYENNVNAIALYATKSNYIGLKSIAVKTVSGAHAVIESITFPEGMELEKTEYEENDAFDSSSIADPTVHFTDPSIPSIVIPSSALDYYDAPSYDEPSDHSSASKFLTAGTTEVVAVYHGFELRVGGFTVNFIPINFTRVKSVSDITDGQYLFVIPGSNLYWKGSMTNAQMKTGDSFAPLGTVELKDTIHIAKSFASELLTITVSDEKYTITNKSGGKIGATGTSTISLAVAASPKFSEWTCEVNDNFVDFTIDCGELGTNYLGFGKSAMGVYNSKKSNVSIYKYIPDVE